MITKQLEYFLLCHLAGTGKYITFEMEVPLQFYENKHWLQGYNAGKERVDAVMYNANNGKWYFYELKVSVNDFRSRAKKSFQGNYNYFVIPKELYEKVKDEISEYYPGIGVLVFDENDIWCEHSKVKATYRELGVNEEHLKISFIRSLSQQYERLRVKLHHKDEHIINLVDSLYQENDLGLVIKKEDMAKKLKKELGINYKVKD